MTQFLGVKKSASMYVCIEIALRGDAHGIGRSNWAKGRDPLGSWVQYPNPQYHRYRVTHAGSYLRTQCALSEPTLLLAAKGVLCPHVEGTVTHRAR